MASGLISGSSSSPRRLPTWLRRQRSSSGLITPLWKVPSDAFFFPWRARNKCLMFTILCRQILMHFLLHSLTLAKDILLQNSNFSILLSMVNSFGNRNILILLQGPLKKETGPQPHGSSTVCSRRHEDIFYVSINCLKSF